MDENTPVQPPTEKPEEPLSTTSAPQEESVYHRPIHARPKRWPLYTAIGVLLAGAAVLIYFLTRPDLSGVIVIPFISHQKPAIDPHLPSTNSLADKLDEVQFDGLFNLVAGPSGVVYEDGLGIDGGVVVLQPKLEYAPVVGKLRLKISPALWQKPAASMYKPMFEAALMNARAPDGSYQYQLFGNLSTPQLRPASAGGGPPPPARTGSRGRSATRSPSDRGVRPARPAS